MFSINKKEIFIKNSLKLFLLSISIIYGNENKLFWDGRDWNQIIKKANYNENIAYKIKIAYINGALDGRLFSYLKIWSESHELADQVFSETVDYLSNRELIKNIDYFYQDPLNSYIPLPSAIIISNMYAERIPKQNIDFFIQSTRRWINDLILDLDTLNYSRLLEDKWIKHSEKKLNQFE
tara:strand:+ start:744 stop:1283 length:540 start_codon:yes stop_codon:yes gene_type:complete